MPKIGCLPPRVCLNVTRVEEALWCIVGSLDGSTVGANEQDDQYQYPLDFLFDVCVRQDETERRGRSSMIHSRRYHFHPISRHVDYL